MIWQDVLMMCVNCIFIFSLGNQVISGYRSKNSTISVYTSLPTGLGLFAMSYAMFTLSLFLTAGFTFLGGILWIILFYQTILYSKKLSN